ncbi:MAG: enoyl-CoA hydratase/isomerase family protein [Alphaproteobacteria bacterium]|jgi:enoyl-CoA hydratase|nr:enoyl-CoA hydratase/isomerase family protein [Alphaproteobacteria bacterium]
MAEHVQVEVAAPLATIRLDRPEVLNALNQPMWGELVDAVRDLQSLDGIRAAILTGNGRAFCVGADLKETAWRGESQAQTRQRIERNQQQLARELIQAPMPIVAAINGYALGGGVEIALAADLRLAAEEARFGFPEVTIGRFISGGASLLLPRIVGPSQAKQLIYTGRQIDAGRALAIGLVDEVVPGAELETRARALAAEIAANAPVSVALAKKVLNRVTLAELETALALETEGLIATYGTADNEAGADAFPAREKPEFRGQ